MNLGHSQCLALPGAFRAPHSSGQSAVHGAFRPAGNARRALGARAGGGGFAVGWQLLLCGPVLRGPGDAVLRLRAVPSCPPGRTAGCPAAAARARKAAKEVTVKPVSVGSLLRTQLVCSQRREVLREQTRRAPYFTLLHPPPAPEPCSYTKPGDVGRVRLCLLRLPRSVLIYLLTPLPTLCPPGRLDG